MPKQDATGHRERLRRRFLEGEAGSRSDEALLELLLTYAVPHRDVQPLAGKLIDQFGSLAAVLDADAATLCRVDGVKTYTAVLLKLVGWIRLGESADEAVPERRPAEQLPLGLGGQAAEAEPKEAQALSVAQAEVPGPLAGDTDVVAPDSGASGERLELTAEAPRSRRSAVATKARPRSGTGLFGKAILKEAIDLLPQLPDTESLDEVREFLRQHLHFNAEQTRQRNANFITRRMFPSGHADRGLRTFARAFAMRQELRDVCLYRFYVAEPLTVDVVHSVLLPAVSAGRAARSRIREYLGDRFPESRSIGDCTQAILDALAAGAVAKSDRVRTSFAYRDILVPSFAFVVHSEFPEPGMYDLGALEGSPRIQAMLWDPDRVLPAVYELRNRGFLSKVSEIDSFRQFTTTLTLDEVVDRLVSEVASHEVG